MVVEAAEALAVEALAVEDTVVDVGAIEVDIEEERLEGEEAVVGAVAEDIIQVIIRMSLM